MGLFSGIAKAVGSIAGGIGKIAGPVTGVLTGNPWLGTAISSATSGLGALYQNKQAKSAASKQMGFQESMSNTSYQRAMADMAAAGLNPILAYQQGGASTPSGSSYTPQNVGSAGVSGAVQAVQMRNMVAQNANLEQQNANMKFDQRLTAEQIRRQTLENDAWSTLSPEMRAFVMSGSGINAAGALARPLSSVIGKLGSSASSVGSKMLTGGPVGAIKRVLKGRKP